MFTVINDTPLAALTVGQFLEVLSKNAPQKEIVPASTDKQYVYGLKGIRETFNVCHSTAQKLKHGILAPAVKQHGRKLIIDRDMAIELFSQNKEG